MIDETKKIVYFSLRIWSLVRDDEKYTVSHSEEISCFVITNDNTQVITGSKDQSLKVWQLAGGKLTQVCYIKIINTKNFFLTKHIFLF